nr:hypothetical protein [Tanacetum cinerariifolium]
MSDSDESGVTYTEVSSPFEDLSDIESDLEAYPEEDDDEDPEEYPVDYLADGGNDCDDKEGSSEDDEDDDMDIEADEEEEEEQHPALADSVVVALPTADQALSAEETEPFKTDESVATPLPHPAYRESSYAAARPAGGLRADYGFVATMDREIRRDPKRGVGYGITDSRDEIVETLQGAPVSTNTELDGYIREFETRVRRDTDEIYSRLDDEQSERQLLAGRLNMLFRDRRAHAYTRHLMETEARLSREAWTIEIRELHAADHRRQIVTSEKLRADHKRFAKIKGLRTADRTRQQQLI